MEESKDLITIQRENPELADLLATYPEEAVDKLMKNKHKLEKISKKMNNVTISTTVNSMVMTCNSSCPFKNVCLLYKEGIDPTGYPCPVEKKMIMELEHDIVKSLEINKEDPIEMEMLWDLIDTKLLDLRSSGALKDGSLIQTIIVEGKSSYKRDEASPSLTMKIEIKKLKHEIIDSFVASRRSKKKYGMSADKNTLEQLISEAAKKVGD